MPLAVNQTPRARQDLLGIWDYIAADNEAAADRLIHRIGRAFDMLADQPHAGRARPELGMADIRSVAVGNYIVLYVPSADAIDVIRVLEGHRDIPTIFAAGD